MRLSLQLLQGAFTHFALVHLPAGVTDPLEPCAYSATCSGRDDI